MLIIGPLVVAPLALLVLNSFRDVEAVDLGFGLTNFTLGNYVRAYSTPVTYHLLLNSIGFAAGSVAIAVLSGGTLAFLSERTDLRFRQAIPLLVLVPLVMPSLVVGIAWILLLSPNVGLLNRSWQSMFGQPLLSAYSLTAMVWVEGISMSTLAFLLVGATMRQTDPSLEDAAAMSGAGPLAILRRITLPLLTPGLAGAVLLLFLRGIESFEVPMLLGFNAGILVFSTAIYHALRNTFPPEYGLGFAYSMMLIVIAIAALYLYIRQLSHAERFSTVRGKSYQPRLIALGKWRYAAWAFVLAYGLLAIALPLLILAWASLTRFYAPPSLAALKSLSLVNYAQVLSHPNFVSAGINTLVLAGVSSVTAMLSAVLVSWYVHRSNLKGRKILDYLVFIPYAVPSIAVGVAFMILFLSFPNQLYNTIWIIVVAYTVSFLPVSTRFTHATVIQIHQELEEAAWMSGAGYWRTLGRVWLPLLLPGLVNGLIFVLVLSVKAMSIAVLLQGPDSLVLSVLLWNLWDRGGATGAAAALSVMLIAVVSVLTLVSRRIGFSPRNARAL
jgi:iron(III) transport system permease protein